MMLTSTEVLFDHWSISEPGSDRGLGRYAATLSTVLDADPRFKPVYVKKIRQNRSFDVLQLQRQINRLSNSVDLYHATVPEHLPLLKTMQWVCSIQDIIPLDLAAYRRLGLKTRAKYQNSKRADVILANSEYTAARVMHRLEVPADRIHIAPIPISPVFSATDETSSRHHVDLDDQQFVVGLVDHRAPDPRKRYHWIEDLAAALKGSGIRVVVTGREAAAAQYPSCVVLPPLSDQELASLYRNAVAFFYPSSYEGQGLPPIEAMASGCPVMAFRNSSVTEMVRESEFLLEDPIPWESEKLNERMPSSALGECKDRIKNIASDQILRRNLGHTARMRASNFQPKNLADRMAEAYAGALR